MPPDRAPNEYQVCVEQPRNSVVAYKLSYSPFGDDVERDELLFRVWNDLAALADQVGWGCTFRQRFRDKNALAITPSSDGWHRFYCAGVADSEHHDQTRDEELVMQRDEERRNVEYE